MTVPRIEWYGNFALQSREHDVRDVEIKRRTVLTAGAFCITSAAHLRVGEQSGSPPDTENIPKAVKIFDDLLRAQVERELRPIQN